MFKKKDKNYVAVPIDSLNFSDSCFNNGNNEYDAKSLYNFAKINNYPTFDMPLCGLNLGFMPFTCNDLDDLIYHFNRVNKCSLEYPIILDNKGCVADGYHRVCKAILNGDKTIKAIRLLKMPPPDRVIEKK